MNRFETNIVALAAFAVAAVHAPVIAQEIKGNVVFDKGDGSSSTKDAIKSSSKGKKPAAPQTPAPPKEPTFLATGGFEKTKDKARESAIRAAVEKLHSYLLDQRPQVHPMPTTEMVRSMLLNEQEKVTEEPIVNENGQTETMYRITVAVRVEDEHVRELRSRERSGDALWILAGLAALAGTLAMFFKVDSWTKGYLTSWLTLGAIGTGALLMGLWWMAK